MPQLIHKQPTGLPRIVKATLYSWDGLKIAWKGEAAFRLECFALLISIPIALILPIHLLSKLLLIGSVICMLIVELLNSAVEAAVDLISDKIHPLAKKAKDTASAAVFVSVVMGVTFWSIVLFSCFIDPLAEF